MWTPGIVLARYTRGRRIPSATSPTGPDARRRRWILAGSFIHDEDDRKGWDDAAKAGQRREAGRGRASGRR
jgi:hypothetical protein